MKKSLIIAGLAASVLLTSSMANAAVSQSAPSNDRQPAIEKQFPQKYDKKFDKKQRPSIDERLKLTEEQKKQWQDLMVGIYPKFYDLVGKDLIEKTLNTK